MSHFVIIFGRSGDPAIERYEDAAEAQARLFEAERELHDDPDCGVVLLYADSEESLRRTHGRLFEDIDGLLATAEKF